MVNRTEEKQSQEHRKGGIVALVSECFFHFDLYIDDTTGCQQFCEDAETGQRLDPSSREDHIQIIYMISMMAASYNAARNLDLFLSYVTRSENRRRKQHPALRPHRQSTGSFCPLRGSVAETIRQPILGPKSSKNWKTANLKLRLDYVNLRICLRVFTGCLRGFYGFSTPTDFFTGYLRAKTWFWIPWVILFEKWTTTAPWPSFWQEGGLLLCS